MVRLLVNGISAIKDVKRCSKIQINEFGFRPFDINLLTVFC